MEMPLNKLPCETILVTENIPGNLHEAASLLNDWGLSDYVVAMDFSSRYTVVVYRVPKKLLKTIEDLENSSGLSED